MYSIIFHFPATLFYTSFMLDRKYVEHVMEKESASDVHVMTDVFLSAISSHLCRVLQDLTAFPDPQDLQDLRYTSTTFVISSRSIK